MQNQGFEPLTILQVASGFPAWGGTELHILNLSKQLSLRGHRVTVACRPGGWVATRAREMGLGTLEATVLQQQDWRDYRKFAGFCRDNRVDVVHAHWSTDALVPPLAARLAGVPVRLLTRHSPYPFKSALGRLVFTRLLYNRILAVSQSVADTLVDCGVNSEKLTVIHHGTDVEAFEDVTLGRDEARAQIGLGRGDVAVGIVGRIASEKGHRYLCDSLARLSTLPMLRLVIVGDGPQADELRAYVAELGLGEKVLWVPFRQDVNNVINALDIVAVPSVWEEPCSAVIQQAMALAKPVVGTRVGGTPEMIVDGRTGLLADKRDAGELADAVRTLASDEALRRRMGDAGAQRVRALFTLGRMTSRIEELYRQELARSGRADAGGFRDDQEPSGEPVPA